MRRFAVVLRVVTACWLGACGGGGGGPDSGMMPVVDSGLVIDATTVCPPQAVVAIGGCVDGTTGDPCSGFGDNLEYVPLSDGDTVTPIVGFQGLAMFVFGYHVADVNPGPEGTPLAWPTVEVAVLDESDTAVTSAEAKPRLVDIGGGVYEGFELQLPYEGDFDRFAGVPLRATMRVTDVDGVLQCGELGFVGDEAFLPGGFLPE